MDHVKFTTKASLPLLSPWKEYDEWLIAIKTWSQNHKVWGYVDPKSTQEL